MGKERDTYGGYRMVRRMLYKKFEGRLDDLGLFIYLLLRAAYRDGHGCKRGQVITSAYKIAERNKTTRPKVRAGLRRLENDGYITQESRQGVGTTITIVDFEDYCGVATKTEGTVNMGEYLKQYSEEQI